MRVLEDLEDEKYGGIDFVELRACAGGWARFSSAACSGRISSLFLLRSFRHMGRQALRVLLPAWPGTAFCRKKGRGARRPHAAAARPWEKAKKPSSGGKRGRAFFSGQGEVARALHGAKKAKSGPHGAIFSKKLSFPPRRRTKRNYLLPVSERAGRRPLPQPSKN